MILVLQLAGFAGHHWRAIAAGTITAVLVIAILLAKMDARHWRKRFGAEAAALAGEKVAHDATRVSVATLKAQIAA